MPTRAAQREQVLKCELIDAWCIELHQLENYWREFLERDVDVRSGKLSFFDFFSSNHNIFIPNTSKFSHAKIF